MVRRATLELEAGVRVVELLAEQLAQAGDPVARRLRVDVKRARHRDGVARVADVGERRLPHPLVAAFSVNDSNGASRRAAIRRASGRRSKSSRAPR